MTLRPTYWLTGSNYYSIFLPSLPLETWDWEQFCKDINDIKQADFWAALQLTPEGYEPDDIDQLGTEDILL